MTLRDELQLRISRLQALMTENKCQGSIIIQNVDQYYFSGTIQNAQLYVPSIGDPLLFCRKSIERASQESPWKVIPLSNFKFLPEKLAGLGHSVPQRLALELDVIPASMYQFLSQTYPDAELIDGSQWIKRLRSIKSPHEIELIRNSGRIMARVYQEAPEFIKQGSSEVDCASAVERRARQLGHQGLVRFRGFNQELFYGHFLSGASGGVPSFVDGASGGSGLGPFFPQSASLKPILANEPISLDYVGVFGGYGVDQTRMFVFGSLPERLLFAFRTALEIQDAVLAAVKPGVIPAELYELALIKAAAAGLDKFFMGYGPNQTRFIGHGIGLELDELPLLAKGYRVPMEAGMVFALEPKFIFPDLGMAGIENTWLVTEDGVEKISDFPDDLVVLS